MPLSAGSRLGPYEILAPLGAGGMGEVYKARDTRLDRTVAIKVLPPEFASDPDRRARFEREARAIAALDHPRICALHDVGEHDGMHFLVMQHLDGETLAARLANGPLPLDQAVQIAIEIADALDKAHRAGITHRDLKPANIMMTKSGARLLDFGLAKLRGAAAPISMSGMTRLATATPNTAHGTILGTVHYMSPEQVEGKEADTRSDIWALGTVIYEMATGVRPFDGESPASIIGSILKDTPPPISARQPLSPATLDHVVRQALDKDPDERWQSAGDVKRELMWLAKDRVASPSGAAAPRGGSYVGWIVAAALAVALAATAPSAVRRWLSTPPEVSPIRFAVSPPENATLTAAAAALPTAQIAISPDGKRLAFVATPQAGRPMLWIRSLDNLQMLMLPGTEEAAFPFWSPDSRFVGFFAQGKLKRTDLVGGTPQALCDVSSDAGRGATWNRDGIIVFVPDSGSGLLQVSDAGGPSRPAIPLREGDNSYRWPSFLPDGRHVLFLLRGPADRRGLYVGTLGETAITRLLDTAYFNAVYSMGHLLTLRDGTLLAYPFDETRLQIVGSPVPVAERVGGTSTQMAALSVSTTGVLAYGGTLKTSSRLTWFDRDGRPQGSATPDAGDYSTFRFSSDERRFAFTQVDPVTGVTQDVWLMDAARGVSTRFTSDPANDISPVWSPDGEQIVFRSDRAGGNILFQKPSTGAENERQLAPIDATFPTDWSPDGRFILYYATLPTTGWDVMVLPLFGERKPIAVSQTRFAEVAGRFAPSGRWIAYASDESGRFEIYVQPFPQSGSRVRVTTSGGFEPRWRRDGKELFYLALDGTLMAVPVNPGATFDNGPPQRLFQTRVPFLGSLYRSDYEVVGDGPRFLVNTLVEGAASAPPITVVLNWTAGLK